MINVIGRKERWVERWVRSRWTTSPPSRGTPSIRKDSEGCGKCPRGRLLSCIVSGVGATVAMGEEITGARSWDMGAGTEVESGGVLVPR